MSDIYSILSKYFDDEASYEEKHQVQQFKLENPKEFEALQSLWSKRGIDPINVDSAKAWEKIAAKAEKPKVIPLYRNLKIVASIAAVFLMLSLIGSRMIWRDSSESLVVSSKDGIQEVELSDGSIVHLNEGATIEFPEEFDTDVRNVTLKGEAFFDVAKDVDRPFKIITNHSTVEVLGTSFNIDTENDQTQISVATGKVKVASLFRNESVILTPNQSAIIDSQKLNKFETENQNYQTWRTGVFNFDKASIDQVVLELNKYYEGRIELKDLDSNCQLSTSFNQLELSEVIEIVKLTCGLQSTEKNGNYELH